MVLLLQSPNIPQKNHSSYDGGRAEHCLSIFFAYTPPQLINKLLIDFEQARTTLLPRNCLLCLRYLFPKPWPQKNTSSLRIRREWQAQCLLDRPHYITRQYILHAAVPSSSVCLRRSIGFLSKIITAVTNMNRLRCSHGPRSGGGEGQVSSSVAGSLCFFQKRDLIQYEDEFSNRNNSTDAGSWALLIHVWLDNNVK